MPLGGKFLGSLRTLGVRLGTSALGGRGLGFVNNAVNTLLHLFNSDGSDDSPIVTYPPMASEHYVTVNNGGANEILYKAPTGAVLRVGERIIYNEVSNVTSEDNTLALASFQSAGTSETATTITAASTADYWYLRSNKFFKAGALVVARVLVGGTGVAGTVYIRMTRHLSDVGAQVKEVVLTANEEKIVTLSLVLDTDDQVDIGLDFRTAISGVNTPTPGTYKFTKYQFQDKTGHADQNPDEYVSVDTVDPRSNIAGMTWSIYENGNTVDANGVVTEAQGTLIPASQRKGVLLEGAGGNGFGTRSLINDTNWFRTDVLPLYESTELAPDGTKMQVMEATGSNLTRIFQSHNFISSIVGLNSLSVVVRYENLAEVDVFDSSVGFSGVAGQFNLITKTFSNLHASVDAYGFDDMPNGSVRIWFSINYTAVGGNTTEIRMVNPVAGSKVHVWQAQFEPQARPSSITNLSSRASTLSPSTNIGQLPDEGELVMTMTALYDFADYQALSTETGLNWFFFQNNINNRILYHNADASVWYSWNGTNATLVVGITWSKDDVLEAHLRWQLSSSKWQLMVRNLTTGIDYIGAETTNFTGWNASTGDLVVNNTLPWIHQDVKLLSTFPDVFF